MEPCVHGFQAQWRITIKVVKCQSPSFPPRAAYISRKGEAKQLSDERKLLENECTSLGTRGTQESQTLCCRANHL